MDKPQSSSIRSSLESTTQCQIQITMARKEIPWRTCSQHSMDKFCQSERRPHTKPRRDSDDDHIDSWLRYGHTFLISFFLFLFFIPFGSITGTEGPNQENRRFYEPKMEKGDIHFPLVLWYLTPFLQGIGRLSLTLQYSRTVRLK